jgi:hypothetical protein
MQSSVLKHAARKQFLENNFRSGDFLIFFIVIIRIILKRDHFNYQTITVVAEQCLKAQKCQNGLLLACRFLGGSSDLLKTEI